jgi:ATP-dependent DNA helicase MPH1
VFFMTPQTLQNDLASGAADPKKIVLLVVDEAHRATGNYAYVTVVNFLRRFNRSFRILALTATPGASVEAVQEIIDNLEISEVEIRTEESIDIQQYVHRRNIDQIVLDPSDEIIMVKELFAKALQPLVNQLCAQNAYWQKDPMSLTPFGLMQARTNWFKSDAGRRANPAVKGMLNGLFTILASVAHGIKLLNFHGIGPFYANVKEFRQSVEDANKPGKYRSQIVNSPDFKKMMEMIGLWLSKDGFIGHPKMTYLCDTILNHFLDAGEGRLGEGCPPSSTRVIVFAEFRDSAEDIARVLNRAGDGLIRASVFVGQADSKRSEGMNQAKQHETIAKFKTGTFNVIVATSIGEEGLDIGQVDLIVCYDASASPIRMLQRMGRTGRKRAGNIVLLLMRGKEEESFAKAKDNYEQMQKMISDGTRFNFRHDLSVRIVPKETNPVVDKRMIEIPVENTQDPGLPEPKRRAGKAKKKLAKKFHMPDGVETGFRTASGLKLSNDGGFITDHGFIIQRVTEGDEIALIPPLESVLLSTGEEDELEKRYQNVAGNDMQEVTLPDLTVQTIFQRSLGPVGLVNHTQYTERCVKLFRTLGESQLDKDRHIWPYGEAEPLRDSWNRPKLFDDITEYEDEDEVEVRIITPSLNKKVIKRKETVKPPKPKDKPSPKKKLPLKRRQAVEKRRGLISSDMEDDGSERDASCDESEGEGEILYSEEPSDDSDDGEDLQDFIAGTDDAIIEDSQSTARSTAIVVQDLGSDDELPETSQLIGRAKAPRMERLDSDDITPMIRRDKRRRVLEMSDSDE